MPKRLKKATKGVKIGDRVYLPDLNVYGEVLEISNDVRGWIEKIKITNADGSVTIKEVSELTVEAVILVERIVTSELFKSVWKWIRNIFRRKK